MVDGSTRNAVPMSLNLQEVACVYGSKVGIAATKNNGKNWYYVGTANLPEPMQGQSTFWAPDVFKHKDTYYMIVTFIPGIHPFWGGDARLVFYKSKDLMNWDLVEEIEGTHVVSTLRRFRCRTEHGRCGTRLPIPRRIRV